MNLKLFLFFFVAAVGAASVWDPRLSVFAFLLSVIALAAQTRLVHPKRRWVLISLCVGTACSFVGLYRFILNDALPGIIEARARASSGRAVSFLREILFAQDAMRRHAMIDPDGDGIGSAALLEELTGKRPARDQSALPMPPLAPRFAPRLESRSGPVTEEDGYYYLVCLPTPGGGWTTRVGETVDEELAERRWVAYAWPSRADLPHETAYFIDEHELILESENKAGGELRLVGVGKSPDCDDALREPSRAEYRPWRDKKPRPELPGDAP